jgi:hypothetical protein
MSIRISRACVDETFRILRGCGEGRRECQALWLSAWRDPDVVARVVHPRQAATVGGFQLEDSFINQLWLELAERGFGVRVQVHTHPGAAFHSRTDDQWPIVHTPGFLSLVIPKFGLGPVGFDKAFLARLEPDGRWSELDQAEFIEVIP